MDTTYIEYPCQLIKRAYSTGSCQGRSIVGGVQGCRCCVASIHLHYHLLSTLTLISKAFQSQAKAGHNTGGVEGVEDAVGLEGCFDKQSIFVFLRLELVIYRDCQNFDLTSTKNVPRRTFPNYYTFPISMANIRKPSHTL